ncbi:hypothetical protein [Pseudogemmobacter humi]|uniref:DUF1127 domain-containing protein n=1 Tax=Pseudogemmobacter humi TaxID=2483812 RepID=A0A3P5X2B7_9RHOB|nr:hypothetical protein [Pseudogemmobacter humi]VDC28279.1 hypothetical protein XINFAN_02055 [Pseudogemmobacter humi]
MFTRLMSLMQLRRSTAFLLERGNDRLLDDIGLTRDDLKAMHQGLLPETYAAQLADPRRSARISLRNAI